MAKNKKDDEIQETAAPEADKPHKAKKEKLSREQELENQLAEKNDQLLRLAAEYDNFRKRSQREKDELFKSSKATVIQELLPVIDNFERAGNASSQSPAEYIKGMELVYSQFLGIIKKLGIETFGEPGEEFDPNIHSAVMHVEDDALEENVIAEVLSKGYKLGDKIIRSATVKVAN
jgi:molecular chaperone GrpE